MRARAHTHTTTTPLCDTHNIHTRTHACTQARTHAYTHRTHWSLTGGLRCAAVARNWSFRKTQNWRFRVWSPVEVYLWARHCTNGLWPQYWFDIQKSWRTWYHKITLDRVSVLYTGHVKELEGVYVAVNRSNQWFCQMTEIFMQWLSKMIVSLSYFAKSLTYLVIWPNPWNWGPVISQNS